jgi:hypothetical protein
MCTLYAIGMQCGLLWVNRDPDVITRVAQG